MSVLRPPETESGFTSPLKEMPLPEVELGPGMTSSVQ